MTTTRTSRPRRPGPSPAPVRAALPRGRKADELDAAYADYRKTVDAAFSEYRQAADEAWAEFMRREAEWATGKYTSPAPLPGAGEED